MKYERPPIQEAVVEFHFKGGSSPSGVGEAFHAAWEARCRKRERVHTQQIQVRIGDSAEPPPPPPVPTDRLWMDDPWGVVQVGTNFLSVHMLRQASPYPGYEHFLPLIHEALAQYLQLASPSGLKAIALRYVNALAIPVNDAGEVADWLTVGVNLPDCLYDGLLGTSVEAVTHLPAVGAQLHYGIRPNHGEGEGVHLILDLRVVSTQEHVPALEQPAIEAWLDAAHTHGIIAPFEGSITDAARESFGIKEDDRG